MNAAHAAKVAEIEELMDSLQRESRTISYSEEEIREACRIASMCVLWEGAEQYVREHLHRAERSSFRLTQAARDAWTGLEMMERIAALNSAVEDAYIPF